MRILDELVGFIYRRGARNIDTNMNFDDGVTFVRVCGVCHNMTKEDLDFLDEVLSVHRQHEVEECYWYVTGDDSFGDELALTGVMIDESKVTYENDIITIITKRIED